MVTGIYQIRNLINDKRYIGSASLSIQRRWAVHQSMLNRRQHHSRYLQNAWNKYGKNMFVFETLEIVDLTGLSKKEAKIKILEREQHYLDTLLFASCNDGRFNQLGYNLLRKADSPLGYCHTIESKIKMGRCMSGSHNPMYGKSHSQQTKNKIRQKAIGRKPTKETCIKMSKSRKGTRIGINNPMYGKGYLQQGEKSVRAKLNNKQVLIIRQMICNNIQQKEIAIIFGVSPATISRIKSGLRYGDTICS